jgi:ankyrin repeat protein
VIDDELFEAARSGDVGVVSALLDAHPEKLHGRAKPYDWSLLHFAAQNGHLAAVDLLLKRGRDVNSREHGDNTYPMHWAAAAGHLDVVRRLADAGGHGCFWTRAPIRASATANTTATPSAGPSSSSTRRSFNS